MTRPARDRDVAFLAPIAIALINFVAIKAIFSQQDNHPLVFMMLGMAGALIYRSRFGDWKPKAESTSA